jgi:3-deoxy-D-manno-octulosonic-acid transferase
VRWFYAALLFALLPFQLAYLWWRGGKNPDYRKRWGERFGFGGPVIWQHLKAQKHVIASEAKQSTSDFNQGLDGLPRTFSPRDDEVIHIWIHAVSVGEFEAARPLIAALQQQHSNAEFLITTTTPTGAARVAEAGFAHRYLPYDLPGAVGRFLDRVQPTMAIVMETELWPNLFTACRTRSIPLYLVNVRLSEKSAAGYQRWVSSLVRFALQQPTAIAAQHEDDAKRLIALGASAEKVRVTGSLKFEVSIPEEAKAKGAALHAAWGERPVWIAASTRSDGKQDEELMVLEAHRQIRKQFPNALLILAPRHPERFAQVARLIEDAGLCFERYSQKEAQQDPTSVIAGSNATKQSMDVFLLDTLGQLATYYAAADVAFVGGSLLNLGLHNPIEPAALAKPVLFGPHRFNFKAISTQMIEAGAAQEVQSADQLAQAVLRLFENADQRRAMGEAGQQLVAQSRGATQRVLELLEEDSLTSAAAD